jgi:lysophospholipase L1-like esterase
VTGLETYTLQRLRRLITSDKPVKWLFIGDSITHGALHTFGARDYVELFAERVRFELDRRLDVIINTAISGDTIRELLAGFDWRVAQFRPHTVFVMIGMNDCSQDSSISPDTFQTHLAHLATRIQNLDAVPVLQTTCPILPGQAPDREPRFPTFMDRVRQVAADHNLPLIDHERFWRRQADRHFFWMSDAFHPNAYGHRALAVCLYRTLGIYDAQSQSCRLHVP